MYEGPSDVSASDSLVSFPASTAAPFFRSGAVARANSASGAGNCASSGSTRAPDQAMTAPALVSRAMLPIALNLRPHLKSPGGVDRCDPAGEIAVAHPLEARILDQAHERFLIGEASDALHKIAIRGAVARDKGAERRDRIEGIGVVKLVEHRNLDAREFEAEKSPAGLKHAERLGNSRIDMRDVANAEGDRIGIEACSREGQSLGIGAHEACAVLPFRNPLAPDLDHLGADVANHGRSAFAGFLQKAVCNVASASGDI